MQPEGKKILKALVLEIRHTLEGWYDVSGLWQPGDVETRLASLGVRRDRDPVPVAELPHLAEHDVRARETADAFVSFRCAAGETRKEAVAELVRETAYTWANRLLALRCMESRELIDEVILQKPAYGGRSLEHHRLAQRQPELCTGEDDGLFSVLDFVFQREAEHLPRLFDARSPGMAIRPSPAALRHCMALLSGTEVVRGQEAASDDVFAAPDALGWAYQFWNTEAKDRVFERVRTEKGVKIEGADIIPATQLYTEDYMVRFLVQNSLGATWMCMHPDSRLADGWEYYVRNADRAPIESKAVREITFLDPACGSGHFHLEAFDLLYAMYEEEGVLASPNDICASILENNLFGIDIDERSIQIAEAALWMRAAEKAPDFQGVPRNLVAANVRLPHGGRQLEAYLAKHPDDRDLRPALETVFTALAHADEIGSLLMIEEPVEQQLRTLREAEEQRHTAFQASLQGVLFDTSPQPGLPLDVLPWEDWKARTLQRLADHFEEQAEAADLTERFFGAKAGQGLKILGLLSRRYDVVAANPPYMGDISMGPVLRAYILEHHPVGAGDLFAAFLARMMQMASLDGSRVALVGQRPLIAQAGYADLRTHISMLCPPSAVAVLGPGGFTEISGAKVSTVLLSLIRRASEGGALPRVVFIDAQQGADKAAILREAVRHPKLDGCCHVTELERFSRLPGSPWAYNLSDATLDLFGVWPALSSISRCRAGISTGDDVRFLRYAWECRPKSHRWKPVATGTGHERWSRQPLFAVDAQSEFARIRAAGTAAGASYALRNLPDQGRAGITYLKNASGRFAARMLEEGTYFLDTSRAVFPCPTALYALLGLLNSQCISDMLAAMGGGLSFVNTDIEAIPVDPEALYASGVASLATDLVITAEMGRQYDSVCEPAELPVAQTVTDALRRRACLRSEIRSRLVELESRLEHAASALYAVPARPCVGDPAPHLVDVTQALDAAVTIESLVLLLIGHRWPKQIAADEPVPNWADADGILPITGLTGEAVLIDRIRERLATQFKSDDGANAERELGDVLGRNLEQWLMVEFFKHHISRHQKRPVAWHIQSNSPAPRTGPAFACLLYYHKLDGMTCDRLQSQYVRPLRARLETELRGIEAVVERSRSSRQQDRQQELDRQIPELVGLDEALARLAVSGFCPPELLPGLRQYALDDAMLSLKAQWLRRLAETVTRGPLSGWRDAAAGADLHPELPAWIADAVAHLDHHCSAVGPAAPRHTATPEDPTSSDLARRIAPDAAGMARDAIRLACDRWWKQLDEAVLAPLRKEIRELRDETKRLAASQAGGLGTVTDEVRRRTLKLDLKRLERELQDRTGRAHKLRKTIEDWTCPEAADWESWLASQPLYDHIASPDGKRPTPSTVAAFIAQESAYVPDLNDGVRVNIAPLQRARLLAADVLAPKDVDKAIADRAEWRADERRWCREGKLPQPGWWPEGAQ